MRNRIQPKGILTLLMTVLYWLACGVDAQILKIATTSPDGSFWMKILREGGQRIAQETDGRVRFKYYGGAVMGSDYQVLRKIRSGQLQGSVLPAGVLTRYYTDVQLYGLPLLFENADEVNYVRALLDDEIRAGIEEAGFVNFGFAHGGFAYAMTKKRVTDIAGIREQKLWIPSNDKGAELAARSFGITPVPLALSDVLLALQANTVNAVAGPAAAALALQWHTQIKYMIGVPLLYTYGTMVIADRAFKRLNVDDQSLVRARMGEIFTQIDSYNRSDDAKALAALREQISYLSLSEAEVMEWRKRAQRSHMTIVDEGVVTRDLYERVQVHLRDYREKAASR